MAGKKAACPCGSKPKLIFPCSGASDVGEIADRAARKMTGDGAGKMYCLAGIGGRVSGIMASTAAADVILAIDGCAHDCARNTLEQAGFRGFLHLRLSDIGLAKGKTPATEERVAAVAAKGAEKLAGKTGGCCGG
jgi:uncharacterized metal-binding protein